MTNSQEVCVAAIALQRLTIARPLQWNHHNWPKHLGANGLQTGRIIRGKVRATQDRRGFPHETEDTQLSDDFQLLERVSEPALFSILAPHVDGSIDELFGGNVQDGRYVIDGTRCRSLGSLLVSAASANIEINEFGKLRFSFEDRTRREYDLPVTDLRVADGPGGFAATRSRLAGAREQKSQILLRIGLVRGFDRQGQWNPKRCYLQVNGIIFPS